MSKVFVYDLNGGLIGYLLDQTCHYYIVQGLGFIVSIEKDKCTRNSDNIIVKK